MTHISKSILFYLENGEFKFKAYLNDDGEIYMTTTDENDLYTFVCIPKDDWEDFKNFIDSEMNKFNEND